MRIGGIGIGVGFRALTRNPVPVLVDTSPTGNAIFSGAKTVLVNGSGFVPDSKIHIDDVEITTTYVSSTQLSGAFPNTVHWITTSATRAITVVTPLPGGGTSNAINYNVTTPTELKWFQRGDNVTLATAPAISAWGDLSSNGVTFSEADPAKQPSQQTSGGPNNQAYVRGTGSPRSMVMSAITLAQPFEIIAVLRMAAWTLNTFIWDGHAAGNRVALAETVATPTIALYAGSSFVAGNTNLAANTWGCVYAKYSGASSSLAVNSGTPTTGNPGAHGFSAGGLTLFCNYLKQAVSFSQSDIAEIHGWVAMTAGQRTEFEAYRAARYAL